MLVTIMSDASFCFKTKASGWGCWAKSQRGSFYCGGNFKSKPKNSTEAEAMAISIAVFAALRQGVALEGDSMIFQTDCEAMVHAYNGDKRGPNLGRPQNQTIKDTVKYTRKLIKNAGCTFEIRHVKAHCPKKAARNYVNNICDKEARKAMESQRKNLKKEAA